MNDELWARQQKCRLLRHDALGKASRKEETLPEGPMSVASLFPRLYAQAGINSLGGFFLKVSVSCFFLEDELGSDL